MDQDLLEEYIQTGNSFELDALLTSNPKIASVKTSHQVSPLMLCCYYRQPELAEIIFKHLDKITFFEAAAIGKTDIIEKAIDESPGLINDFSDDGFTPLGLASYFGNEDVVRLLLLKGADPNTSSMNGYNVYPIHSAVASNYDMIAKMLIEAGANVNVVQMSGATPLHSAAHNGNIDLLIVLLEAGADVNALTEDGKTPADKASEKGFAEIAKILS
ncbi:ankyrin repeat domain-containing protein [Daejeonella lutea]|uniref:Ankyrin repeat n=1 Tax=Daejeonella lutea TaxID=572036 RepID=A0A1T5AUW4_9SPHI|nr:ankyrin repeat domain-containing protein [Daejeonella lutea]SKB38597.1 Ankyrin repeat [Daejeonella lutea]